MKQLLQETEARFDRFSEVWFAELERSRASLQPERPKYLASYRRLVSLQAWRSQVLEVAISEGSLAFFLEAQNDGLVSHVSAETGSWRLALQALRSCLENVLNCIYYKDHPIELALWNEGRHRLGFQDLIDYIGRYPTIGGFESGIHAIELAKNEYATLSKAVHASAPSFRMTGGNEGTLLWRPDVALLGAWQTRQVRTLISINLMLLMVFREQVLGARNLNLRKSVSLSLPDERIADVRQHLGVRLFSRT